MAKISKINVAITGDATGLVAATDKATTNLRKFRAEQERSQKRLSGMQGTVNKTAESLGKLGMQSRGLGALSGGLGLMQAGPAGLALAGVGAMASVVSSINSAIEGMGDQRKQAAEAAKIIAREPWRRAEEVMRSLSFREASNGRLLRLSATSSSAPSSPRCRASPTSGCSLRACRPASNRGAIARPFSSRPPSW